MSCPLHSNDNSCAGCAKVKIQRLERQLAEARANIYKYAEIALMEGKDEFGYSWEDFKHFVLDEQLKEKGDE